MITLAIALFTLAALIGVSLAIPIAKGRSPNRYATAAHGTVAIAAFLLLLVYAIDSGGAALWASVALFALAAAGGLTLAYRDVIKKRPGPVALVAIHALAAAAALITALAATFA